ncbi:MAG: hypothetical protein ABIQ96_12665 [Luteolibacter sp.]
MNRTGDMAANQGSEAIPIEATAAVPHAKPTSNPFTKKPGTARHTGDPLPSVHHASALLPAADQASNVLPTAGQAGAQLPTAGQAGAVLPATGQAGTVLPATRTAEGPATSIAPTGSELAPERIITAVSAEDPVPQPAALADLGSGSTLTPEQDHEVQQMAENWAGELSGSGLDPASPEYRQFWDDAVRQSDLIFTQLYGGEAWHAHHIAAYHLAHAAEEQQQQ